MALCIGFHYAFCYYRMYRFSKMDSQIPYNEGFFVIIIAMAQFLIGLHVNDNLRWNPIIWRDTGNKKYVLQKMNEKEDAG